MSDDAQKTLDWARKTAAGHIDEEIVAAQMFRPRGAWGDKPRHIKRRLYRSLGVAGGGLHPLERDMAMLNVALVTPSALVLCPLRTARSGFSADPPFASLKRDGLEAAWKPMKVTATHQAGNSAPTTHQSKIVVATLTAPESEPLQVDLPDGPVTRHFREELSRSR
ncbi:MAG TPA: hypothetical protein VGF21_13330 [Thermoleophilaceae bacterium]